MIDQTKNAGFSLTNLATFEGFESSGYAATLKFNGIWAATVMDEGEGGPLIVRWVPGSECAEEKLMVLCAALSTSSDVVIGCLAGEAEEAALKTEEGMLILKMKETEARARAAVAAKAAKKAAKRV